MPIGPILRAMNHNRTRVVLIILEIAVTLAIVTNCVNMIVDERRQMNVPSGFDDDNLLSVRSNGFLPDFKENPYRLSQANADLRILNAVPGVRAALNTGFLPWQGGGSSGTIKAAGTKDAELRTQFYYTNGDLFATLGTKLIEGRNFAPNDYEYDSFKGNPKVVIISRKLAELVFKTPHAVGKQIDDGSNLYTVVGVLDPFYNPYGWPIHEYVTIGPASFAGSEFLVRVQPGAMKSVIPMIEAKLLRANRGRVVTIQTVNDVKDQFFSQGRLVMKAMTAVIVLLVFITALGIIGITSLSVAERTKQIGTRRALGATKGDILRHFVIENWMLTTAGLGLGIFATYALNFLLVTHVSGVKMDWRYVAIGMALLWLNGVVATVLPALRGASVSPAVATRSV
jgi:putative ABC transport system permease protein